LRFCAGDKMLPGYATPGVFVKECASY